MKKITYKNVLDALKSKTLLAVSGGLILMSCGTTQQMGGYSETDGVYYDPNKDTLPEGVVINEGNKVDEVYNYQDSTNIIKKSQYNEQLSKNRYKNWNNKNTSNSDWGNYAGTETNYYNNYYWDYPYYGWGSYYPYYGYGNGFGFGWSYGFNPYWNVGYGYNWGDYYPYSYYYGYSPYYYGYSPYYYGYYSPYYYGYSPYYYNGYYNNYGYYAPNYNYRRSGANGGFNNGGNIMQKQTANPGFRRDSGFNNTNTSQPKTYQQNSGGPRYRPQQQQPQQQQPQYEPPRNNNNNNWNNGGGFRSGSDGGFRSGGFGGGNSSNSSSSSSSNSGGSTRTGGFR